WIATSEDKDAAYLDALDQVDYAAERERLAVESLAEIDDGAGEVVPPLLEELGRREAQALREVELAYRQATGRNAARERPLSDAEQRLSELKPALIAGPTEFLTGRRRVRGVGGLHGLMRFEVMNAVNGERSGLDIYRYVAAEAREAGAHYYGTVTAEAVLEYLENAAAAELIRLE
ncbi:MAG: hypothetical protein JSW46_00025, partial [Gemmatimonadota bacterium]